MQGHHAQAQPDFHALFDGPVAVHFHADGEAHAALRQNACDRAARAGVLLAHQEGFGPQFLQAYPRLPVQTVPFGGDDHQGVVHEGFGHQIHFAGGLAHQHDVGLVVLQQLHHAFAVGHFEVDFDFREAPAKLGQHADGEIMARAGDGDDQAAALRALQFFDQRFRLVKLAGDGFAEGVEFFAGLGQVDFLAQALEQRQADGFLELLDLHGHGRLGQVEVFRRPGEAQAPGHPLEHFQLPECDVHDEPPPE